MEVDSTTSANIVYLGQTDPAYGSAQYGSAVWQITKIDSTTANVVKMSYANSGSFNQVWNSRGTLNYTF
jgi:hypothetical protein